MGQLDKIKAPVSAELKEFDNLFKKLISSDIGLLNLLTRYVIRQKGKQIRPLLVFLSAKACGQVTEQTHAAASLLELMHTATLVHDDVVDDANQRRGVFSIKAIWRSKIAVLLGDYLLAKGLLHAVDTNSPELLRIVSAASKELSEGELLQIQKSRRMSMDMDTYFEVIRKKTASLLSACTLAGAHSACADKDAHNRMEAVGHNLGMAFQIKDDLFDYQDNNGTGKPKGNDIKEKKLTLPLLYALEQTDPAERRRIRRVIQKGKGGQKAVNQVVEFVKSNNGVSYSIEKMQAYRDEALKNLSSFPETDSRAALAALIEYTIQRRK